MKSLPQHKTDSEVWVPDYLTPSWVSLPDDRPVLAIIQPGETAMEALETLCKVNVMCTRKQNFSNQIDYLESCQTEVPRGR